MKFSTTPIFLIFLPIFKVCSDSRWQETDIREMWSPTQGLPKYWSRWSNCLAGVLNYNIHTFGHDIWDCLWTIRNYGLRYTKLGLDNKFNHQIFANIVDPFLWVITQGWGLWGQIWSPTRDTCQPVNSWPAVCLLPVPRYNHHLHICTVLKTGKYGFTNRQC